MKKMIAVISLLLFIVLPCFAAAPPTAQPAASKVIPPYSRVSPVAPPSRIDAWDALAALAIHRDPGLLRGADASATRADDFNMVLELARRQVGGQAVQNSTASGNQRRPILARQLMPTAGAGCAAAGIGTVSGQVTGESGAPVAGIMVMLEPDYALPEGGADCGVGPMYICSATTGNDGFYTIGFDQVGPYRLLAYDPEDRYLYQYYQNVYAWDQATILDLTEGQHLEGIDFALEQAASLEGRVTDAASGEGVSNVLLMASLLGGGTDYPFAGYGYSDADGVFIIPALPPGQYQVSATDPAAFYLDASNPEAFTLSAGQAIVGIQLQLAPAGTGLTGTLKGPDGRPLENANVWASGGDAYCGDNYGGDYYCGGMGITDALGRYRLGLASGTYYLQAWDYSGEYLNCYYPGTPRFEDAETLTLAQDQILTGVDFALARAGRITGSVSDSAAGSPVAYVSVEVFDQDGWWISSGYSDETGVFTVGGLSTGTYKIMATDWSMLYAAEWYDGRADFASADPVAVVQGQTHAGRVVDAATGAPVAYAMLMAWTGDGDSAGELGNGYADEGGNFTIAGLTTGRYYLYAYDAYGGYIPTYFDGVTQWEQASTIGVTTGETTTGVVMRMQAGGRILGSVHGPTAGEAVPYALIQAFDGGLNWMGFAFADEAGAYQLGGLLTGTYYLQAYDSNGQLAAQWYANAGSFEQATPVQVAQGGVVGGIDFLLPPGGRIAGTVKDADGNPLPWLTVVAFQDLQTRFMEAVGYTDESGHYVITGLASGRYYVGLYAWNGMFYYYPGTTDPGAAWPVTVVQGQETAGVDFNLSTGGSISGTVTDQATGEPLLYAQVIVVDALGMAVSWAMTDEAGHYLATWIPQGSYKAAASSWGADGMQCYQEEWYREKADYDSAAWIQVGEDADIAGIDFTLTPIEDCPGTWPPGIAIP